MHLRRLLRFLQLSLILTFLAVLGFPARSMAAESFITEFQIPTLKSGPEQIVAGSDGALWFTERSANKIGRVTPAGEVSEYPVPTPNANLRGITTGPDGALWFSEYDAKKIGRMMPGGGITEYLVPSKPLSITTGPDGALWYTAAERTIGRLARDGTVREYAIAGLSSGGPTGITAGPDGNLWFAVFEGFHVGRITPAGTITLFSVPPSFNPYMVAAGSDGNLWFTSLVSQIGRMTPDGTMTVFTLPTRDTSQQGITAGPDGNLWFTEYHGKIGRITLDGMITEYALPTEQSAPIGITTGPDGNIWFVESAGNKIGRVTLSRRFTWEPRISIVWPHDAQGHQTGVTGASAVNVGVWPRYPLRCGEQPPATPLWMAINNEPVVQVRSDGVAVTRTIGSATFPALDYDNVPVEMQGGTQQYRFIAGTESNVWVHASDARTFLPQPVVPAGYSTMSPAALDARIQIIFPHDERGNPASVETATFVNIGVDLFEHGTLRSVPPGYSPAGGPRLLMAQRNNRLEATTLAVQKIEYRVNGQAYPRWVFNNVPVDPFSQYHFMVELPGIPTSSTIWTHAQDARTYLPNPESPAGCGS